VTRKRLAAEARIPFGSITRALNRLAKERPKLIEESIGKWMVTKAGKQALEAETPRMTETRYEKRNGEP
jgi:hypothetical protein